MDVFQELPVDQWPQLRDKVKSLWPLNVGGYYASDVNIKHTKLRDAFHFKIYCPHGDINNGFITTSTKSDTEYMIFPTNENTDKLEEALLKTNIVNWNSNVYIGMASSLVLRLMENLKPKLEFKVFNTWEAKMYFLDKSAKPFDDVKCPPDTHLAAVETEHIKQVNDAWTYRHSASNMYFTTLISNGLSYGLYSADKKLLAWIFINEYNCLCHLYCEPSHRRKGYGEFLLKNVANDLLKKGNDVFGFVLPENDKASELFTKHGFKLVDEGAWINVCK